MAKQFDHLGDRLDLSFVKPDPAAAIAEKKRQVLEGLQRAYLTTGLQRQVIMRPLKSNVPDMPGGTLKRCAGCRQPCWKTECEPDIIPPFCDVLCTTCALRQGMIEKRKRKS